MPTLRRDGNISNKARLVFGDVEAGFAASAQIFKNRFATTLVHPGYAEPRTALAVWDESDKLTVWSNTQLPFDAQSTLAEIFHLTTSDVRVVATTIGGGFGGKLRLGVEHYAAAMAKKTGRPVKMITTSEEELTAALPRQPVVIELKTGVSADGLILAKEARIFVDTGATSGSGVGVASSATLILAGPYKIPNLLLESVSVYTNKTPTGSFRAPAGPQANFAVESQMDIIADAIGIDPLLFRLKNIVHDGDLGPNGQPLQERQHRDLPAPGRCRDRLGRTQARAVARQRHRLRLVDDHFRIFRRLRQGESGRPRRAQYRLRGDRHRRADGCGASARRRSRHRPGRTSASSAAIRHRRRSTTARRAAAPRSRSATHAGRRRRTSSARRLPWHRSASEFRRKN